MTPRILTVAELEQWTLAGAHWRVLSRAESRAELELCACTGERVEVVEVRDPATLGYVLERQASEDAELQG